MQGYELGHVARNRQSRVRKAAMIAAVLDRRVDMSSVALLDIGTGAGVIASALAVRASSVTSVDVEDARSEVGGYAFHIVEDETLPFPAASFDVVVSNHVIEHVSNQQRHLSEIKRVLKTGGLAYLATPNRLWPIEAHYRLPFLAWLPRGSARIFLRVIRKRRWDITPVSPFRLNSLVTEAGFNIVDESSRVLSDPAAHGKNLPWRLSSLMSRVPLGVWASLSWCLPTHVKTLRPYV